MLAGGPFRLRRALLCAVLWCAIVTLAESMDQPVGQMPLHEQISFIVLVGCNFLAPGLIWSLGAELPASRRNPLLAATLLLPTATAASILTLWVLPPLFSHSSSMAEILFRPPIRDFAGHVFWANLFYGGMFAAAYHHTRQNLELRRRLAALRLVLGEAEMRLREARLQTLHEQLRPETLVQALRALKDRYTRDPAAGDRLFDTLVVFLRATMPGPRGGSRAEPTGPSLIEVYTALRNAIDPTVLRWRVAHDALRAAAVPAPRGVLAVLDHIDGAVSGGRKIEVQAFGTATEYVVRIRIAEELEPPELRRLIEALHGSDLRAVGRCGADTVLEIVLRVPSTPDRPEPTPEDDRLQHQGGRHVANLA